LGNKRVLLENKRVFSVTKLETKMLIKHAKLPNQRLYLNFQGHRRKHALKLSNQKAALLIERELGHFRFLEGLYLQSSLKLLKRLIIFSIQHFSCLILLKWKFYYSY